MEKHLNIFLVRSKLLRGIDSFFSFVSLLFRYRPNQTIPSLKHPKIDAFIRDNDFFSETRPIIGRVTESVEDFHVCCQFLQNLPLLIPDSARCTLASLEVLIKGVAYRNLSQGMEIPLFENGEMNHYIVDHVFNLWGRIPSFGLIPKNKGVPILLFRGTDISFTTMKAWTSVVCDFDVRGPGFSVYQYARDSIQTWLKGKKARAMGYSLGGALVSYTVIFDGHLLNPVAPSVSFNAPGLFPHVKRKWSQKTDSPPLHAYIVTGDPISKVGSLIGSVHEFSFPDRKKPIELHTSLLFLS